MQLHDLTIYQVNPAYFTDSSLTNFENGTLSQLAQLIPVTASIWLVNDPEIDFWYRMPLVYTFKDLNLGRDLAKTDYMLIETSIHRRQSTNPAENDYLILGPTTHPSVPAELIWSNPFASAWRRIQDSTSSARRSQE